MIGVDQLMDIHELHREGHSIRTIAHLTGLPRNTVRKVLRGEHDLRRKPATKGSASSIPSRTTSAGGGLAWLAA